MVSLSFVNNNNNKDAAQRALVKKAIEAHGKVKCGAVASLFSSSGSSWQSLDTYGAALLVKDSETDNLSIDVVYYEPWQEKGQAVHLWRHYLYYDFHKYYKKLSDNFHCFESNDCVYGLNFLDAKDAESFFATVLKKAGKECVKGKEKSGILSLFGKSSSSSAVNGNKKKGTGTKKLTIDDMTDPADFQHLIHIGFNPLTGAFEPHNVPPEWAVFFERAGLSKSDLQDKHTATYVAKFVQENVIDATGEGPAAPHEPVTHAMPPPPPPVQSAPSTIPEVPLERASLMNSIRNSGVVSLKPVQSPSSPKTPEPAAGSDLMASMLAKALAERNQNAAVSNDSDDDW